MITLSEMGTGPRGLMKLVEENFADLEIAPDARRLINCVLTAWHMQDWVRQHWLGDWDNPEHSARWEGLIGTVTTPKSQEKDFRLWLKTTCPGTDVLRNAANQSKHSLMLEARAIPSLSSAGVAAMVFTSEMAWTISDRPSLPNGWMPDGTETLVYRRPKIGALVDVIEFWRAFLAEHVDWA